MADESEIRVVITGVASDLRRALEGAKGDLGGLKTAIKDVPNQVKVDVNVATLEAAARLRSLQSQIGEVPDRISIDVGVDDGVANARLDLLNAKVRATERQIARAELGGAFARGGGGGGPGFLSQVGGSFASGGLPLAGPLGIGVAAAPFVAGAAGSVTAIAGSAGAATLGAGALGTAGLGSLLAGIGPLVALSGGLKDAIALSGQLDTAQKNLAAAQQLYGGQNKALTTAQDNYNAAVKAFGPNSAGAIAAHAQLLLVEQKHAQVAPQITSAQNALNKLMIEADPAVLAFAKSWGEVTDALDTAEQQVLPAFATALRPVLDTVTHLFPTLVQMAKIDLRGISAGLKPLLDFLDSPGFKATLIALADTFAKLGGPLGDAFTNILRALLNVAVAASPYLVLFAQQFDSWTRSFAASLSPGQHLSDLVGGLVGQFHSWLGLAGALGGVLITLLKSGAQQGQGLVDQLTAILIHWKEWLNSTAGQAALHKFFSESLDLLRGVAGLLGAIAPLIASLAVGLIPAMTTLLRPLAELITTISQWVNDLAKHLPPVINALPGLAVAVGVLASWKALQAVVSATTAMMLGKVGLGGAAGVTATEAAAGAGGADLVVGGAAATAVALPAALLLALETGGPQKGKAQPGLASALGPLGATKTTSNILDRVNPFDGSGFLGLGAAQTSTQSKATVTALQAIADGLKGIVDPAQLSTAQLQKLRGEIDKLITRPDLTKTQRDGLLKLEDELATGQGPISAVTKFGQIWEQTFQGISQTTGSVFTQVKNTLHTDLKNISDNLGTGTKQGQQALVGSLSGALQTILDNTSATVRGTAKGIAAINAALDSSLKALGATQHAIDKLGPVVTAQVFTGFQLPTGPLGKAGGGLIQVGRPGERGPDNVPMNVGGVPIRVGAGEKVGVFNYQQQALAQQFIPGGIDGLFAATAGTRHDMATGGYAFPFGGSGFSWGRTDQGVDFSGAGPIGAVGPGRVTYSNANDGWYPPAPAFMVYQLTGGPDSGRYIYLAEHLAAMAQAGTSVNAGQAIAQMTGGIEMGWAAGPLGHQILEAHGGDHLTAAGQDFDTFLHGLAHGIITGGLAGGAGITAPKWTGPAGAIGALGQAAVASVLSAANSYLAAHGPAGLGSASLLTGGAPSSAAAAANEALGHQMMLAGGWPETQWPFLEALWTQESGWSATARNPGSGAAGIPQDITGNFHGGAAGQIAWGLDYIRGRYGTPEAAEAHERAFNWYAQGGIVPGFAGGTPDVAHAARAPKKPPTAPKHKHPKTTAHHAKFIPKDALKGLLSPEQLKPDRMAALYDRQVTVDDQLFSNLLAAQAADPVDDPPLVTLSDADVKALDPDGSLGYEAGDEIVNQSGMTAGRFFGPGGAILGGTFHPGVSTRLSQIAAILSNRGSRLTSLENEEGAERAAIGIDKHAIKRRQDRKARIERYLHASVVRAGVVKGELDVLKSKNLQQALKDALSKQAVGKRLTDLRGHLRIVTDELATEQRYQAGEAPIARDPTHTEALKAQAQNIRDSIAIESTLGTDGSAAVQKAKSAIYKDELTKQLRALEKTNTTLGGKPLDAGTGGAIGTILSQLKTLGDDRDGRTNTFADFQLTQIVPAKAEIQSYVKEQADLGTLINIQPRSPDVAAGPDLAALNQLLATQLANTQQSLALSQAQFGVLQGFEPLLEGRLIGSFASGIDFVPRTGVALVHRGETIIPDPGGPYGNRAAAATVQTAQGPVEITLTFQNNETPLVKLIDARMNQKALQITSDHAGQRARLLTGVRRP